MQLQENPKNILIIRLSSLGDVLLASPVIRALRNKYPEAKIDFLVKPQYADAVQHNINLNNVFVFDDYSQLYKKEFDFVVDLQNNLRSKRIRKKIPGKQFVFKKPNLKKLLLVKFKKNFFNEIKSIPERYADAVPGLTLDNNGLDLYLPGGISPSVKLGTDYIGFCPGAKHFTKRWLPEYFIHLGNMLTDEDFTILLFGGEEDKILCERISAQIPGSINLSNSNNLFQTSADMKLCKAVVCNDSGLMHTACASGVPAATFFGSTVKEFGFFPYNSTSLVLENKSLNCRPCSHIGRDSCPLKHFKCMKDITPDLVYVKLHELIKSL